MKAFPKSIQSERFILGALLIDNSLIYEVAGEIEPDDFYKSSHKELYVLMRSWIHKSKSLDVTLLIDHLVSANDNARFGNILDVMSLPEAVGSTMLAEHHAKNVREKAIRRRMILASEKLKDNATDSQLDIDELIEQGQKDLLDIAGRQRGDDWFVGPQLVERAQTRWEKLAELKANDCVTALSTGLVALDNVLSGLHPGLTLLAARPSMGKTAMALNLTVSALEKQVPVAFFSLEMSADQLTDRMASSLAKVNAWNIKTGDLSSKDWGRLESDALDFLHDSPLFVSDKAGVSISKITAQARRLKSKQPNLGLVVIDYLQLIRQPKAESMEQSVSQVSSALKVLSRDLDVPVLCLAQLNRGCEQRTNKRPMLSDLRGSGSLEQDADVVMFLYRHHYYDERADPSDAEILVTKHRSGPTGTVNVDWNATNQKFEDKSRHVSRPINFSQVKRTRRDIDDDDSEPTWL
jgi:replicative DNA helicase